MKASQGGRENSSHGANHYKETQSALWNVFYLGCQYDWYWLSCLLAGFEEKKRMNWIIRTESSLRLLALLQRRAKDQ